MLLTIHHLMEAESLVDSAMHGEHYAGHLQSLSPTFWTGRRDFRDGPQMAPFCVFGNSRGRDAEEKAEAPRAHSVGWARGARPWGRDYMTPGGRGMGSPSQQSM